MEKLEKTAAALRRRGFDAAIFETAKEAADYLLSDMPAGETVGFGGCMTAKQMGLETLLRANGHKVLWHWETPKPERPALLREAMNAPLYVCSANAVTEKGQIVNIDGFGNRLAATLFGPGRVYMIVGKNKLCKDLEAGLDRIKNVACPKNAKRLGLQTPCAVLGRCTDCSSPQRMCKATLVFDRCPGGQRIEVVLVEEELGY